MFVVSLDSYTALVLSQHGTVPATRSPGARDRIECARNDDFERVIFEAIAHAGAVSVFNDSVGIRKVITYSCRCCRLGV